MLLRRQARSRGTREGGGETYDQACSVNSLNNRIAATEGMPALLRSTGARVSGSGRGGAGWQVGWLADLACL